MFRIDVTSNADFKDIEVIFIIKLRQHIKLCLELTEANEESNKEDAQMIGTLKFNTMLGMDNFEEYEKETLQHAKKLLSKTDYFYLDGQSLRLTSFGLDQVPDGRAIIF